MTKNRDEKKLLDVKYENDSVNYNDYLTLSQYIGRKNDNKIKK